MPVVQAVIEELFLDARDRAARANERAVQAGAGDIPDEDGSLQAIAVGKDGKVLSRFEPNDSNSESGKRFATIKGGLRFTWSAAIHTTSI